MISRILLSLLLLTAGGLHWIFPDLFSAAIPFPFKTEINRVVGLLEIILGFGLWHPAYRDLSARLSALWFLLLTPVHIYVSVNQIAMFGFDHPALLWGRTLMQPALYFWALSLQNKGWLMAQRWSDVVFLHYEVDAKKLQERVPFPIDLYQGKAIVSIVPFVMSRIRFPFIIPVPGVSKLLELNLRTYIKVNDKPAVYFFTLDSNHLPAVLIARWFFSLPYRWVKLTFTSLPFYAFESPQFKLKARIGASKVNNAFDYWATERYALFTKRGDTTLMGIVNHPKWSLSQLEVIELKDEFSKLLGSELPLGAFVGAAYCPSIDVSFKPFIKLVK
jgi:uncharacterized protein YqjF (DUF2071 family)